MDNAPDKVAGLFERAISYLTETQRPPVLQAFEHIGIQGALIAEVLGLEARVVSAWRLGRAPIPAEHRVTLLAYLVVLLPWLFAAETQVGHLRPALWPHQIESARRLLEMEMHAAPSLARKVRALADEMDDAARKDAIHVATQWRAKPPGRPARRTQTQPQRRAEPLGL